MVLLTDDGCQKITYTDGPCKAAYASLFLKCGKKIQETALSSRLSFVKPKRDVSSVNCAEESVFPLLSCP